MTDLRTRLHTLGDSAFLIRLGGGRGADVRAQALVDILADSPPAGLRDISVAYDVIAVYFDPLATSRAALAEAVLERLTPLEGANESSLAGAAGEVHTISVRYDGPDLDYVAAQTGLSPARVIELHSESEYAAHAIGFVPGFAFLGDLDERLRLPRRATPRTRVPPGSVAIAGSRTGIYPFETPGGWHLIGRTDARLFDPSRDRPALLRVGARVRFVPVHS